MVFSFPKLKFPKGVTWDDVREQILKAIEEEKDELAVIEPFEYEDMLTQHRIEVRVNPFYSILSVDGREYYFKRETGKFDGTAFLVKEH